MQPPASVGGCIAPTGPVMRTGSERHDVQNPVIFGSGRTNRGRYRLHRFDRPLMGHQSTNRPSSSSISASLRDGGRIHHLSEAALELTGLPFFVRPSLMPPRPTRPLLTGSERLSGPSERRESKLSTLGSARPSRDRYRQPLDSVAESGPSPTVCQSASLASIRDPTPTRGRAPALTTPAPFPSAHFT
jgi:hypothetical protein